MSTKENEMITPQDFEEVEAVSINELAERAYKCALRRGQVTVDVSHESTVNGLANEFAEFVIASEELPSEHLSYISEADEEIIDILIVCLTELKRRGLNAEYLIEKKIGFNEQR